MSRRKPVPRRRGRPQPVDAFASAETLKFSEQIGATPDPVASLVEAERRIIPGPYPPRTPRRVSAVPFLALALLIAVLAGGLTIQTLVAKVAALEEAVDRAARTQDYIVFRKEMPPTITTLTRCRADEAPEVELTWQDGVGHHTAPMEIGSYPVFRAKCEDIPDGAYTLADLAVRFAQELIYTPEVTTPKRLEKTDAEWTGQTGLSLSDEKSTDTLVLGKGEFLKSGDMICWSSQRGVWERCQ